MKNLIMIFLVTSCLVFAQNKYDPKVILKKQIIDAKENPVLDSDTINKDSTNNWQAIDALVKLPKAKPNNITISKEVILASSLIILGIIIIVSLIIYFKGRKTRKTIKTIEYIRDGRIVPEYNKQLIKFRKKLSDSKLVESDKREELQQTAKDIGITLGELELASKIKKLKEKKNKINDRKHKK